MADDDIPGRTNVNTRGERSWGFSPASDEARDYLEKHRAILAYAKHMPGTRMRMSQVAGFVDDTVRADSRIRTDAHMTDDADIENANTSVSGVWGGFRDLSHDTSRNTYGQWVGEHKNSRDMVLGEDGRHQPWGERPVPRAHGGVTMGREGVGDVTRQRHTTLTPTSGKHEDVLQERPSMARSMPRSSQMRVGGCTSASETNIWIGALIALVASVVLVSIVGKVILPRATKSKAGADGYDASKYLAGDYTSNTEY